MRHGGVTSIGAQLPSAAETVVPQKRDPKPWPPAGPPAGGAELPTQQFTLTPWLPALFLLEAGGF